MEMDEVEQRPENVIIKHENSNVKNMIELNLKQLAVIVKYLKGKISAFQTSEEDMITFGEVIKKAEKLFQETDADFGDDLIVWFYGKCKQNLSLN